MTRSNGLRIAVDGRELEGNVTGVGRYLDGLLRGWAAIDGDETFVVFTRGTPSIELPAGPRFVHRPLGREAMSDTWWQQWVLHRALRDDPAQVLFAPADSMPVFRDGPAVLTVHDLSYHAHPEWFGRRHGARLRRLNRISATRATRVVAISEFTRRELIERLDVPDDRIQVVPHGADPRLGRVDATPPAELRRRIGFDGPFAMAVGSIFDRRPMTELFEALARIPGPFGLVIVGEDRRRDPGDLDRTLQQAGLEGRATWLRFASDADLAGLYRTARCLVYLSRYEGFGLPPLEAMQFGVPAVVSDAPALGEIYADAALLVGLGDVDALATALQRLRDDDDFHRETAARGTQFAGRRSIDDVARETLEQIRRAAGRR